MSVMFLSVLSAVGQQRVQQPAQNCFNSILSRNALVSAVYLNLESRLFLTNISDCFFGALFMQNTEAFGSF